MQNVIFTCVKMLQTGFNRGKQKVVFYPELYSSLLFLPVSVCLSVCVLGRRQKWDHYMVWWPVRDPTVECCALLGVPRGVVVKEPTQPLRCLVECYVICAKMCVCTFFCLPVHLCMWITRLYVQCVTFLHDHKALWNNMYQLKKRHAG